MFQNWISLISNFKFSLPNILFFVFLILGFIIWKLYSDIAKKQNSKNIFSDNINPAFLDQIHSSFTPVEISNKPSNFDQSSSYNSSLARQSQSANNNNVFSGQEKSEEKTNRNSVEQNSDFFFKPEEKGLNLNNNFQELNNLIQPDNQELLPIKPNHKVNILKKVQTPPLEKDFDGYLALQEIAPEEEESDETKTPIVFCPLLEVKGVSIPRFKQIAALKKSLEANEVLFLLGPSSIGKSYLVSLLAREIKYSEARSIISFSFSQNTSSLNEAIKLILIEQLKMSAQPIENPIQTFFKIVTKESFLILFNNVEFLPNSDLMLLYNCNLGKSKAILISSSLSARSLCQNTNLAKRSIIELQEIETEIVQSFFLERIPQAFSANPITINKLTRFVKGNPLVLVLLCAFVDREFRNNPETALEDIFRYIDNVRALSDKNIPINLAKMLNLTLLSLANHEKDILLFCSYLPLESFSASLIEYIFDLPSNQGIQFLDSLNSLGLMQRLAGESFQNPRFIVHPSVKDFIYKEYKLEGPQINQLVSRIVLYFIDLLEDKNKIKRENNIFIISGLLYALKTINLHASQQPQISKFNNIFEKAINYLGSLGLYEQIQNNILPIFSDNLNNSHSATSKASWERLIGLSLLLIGKNKNSQPEKIEIINQALQSLNQSLNLYSSSYSAHNTRQLHNDLGNTHLILSDCNDAENNLIKAVDHFKKAIQVQVQATNALEYVQSHINLGNAYLSLYKIKPSPITVQLAIQILSKIINTFGSDLDPENRSLVHQSLGNALRSLASHEEPISNLQSAIQQYKASLEGANQRAVIYNSLGCCYWKIAKYHSPTQNIELAISAYKKSLEFISENWSPFSGPQHTIEYAVTQNNLGTSYKTLASLKNPENNLTLALRCFKEALQIAEKHQDQGLVKVINQHLFELSNLVDGIIRHKPEHRENMYKFKQSMTQALLNEGT